MKQTIITKPQAAKISALALAKAPFLNADFFDEYEAECISYMTPVEAVQFRWDVNWSASFGYDRKEQYYNTNTNKIEDRTVTDWRPASGRDTGSVTYTVITGENIPATYRYKLIKGIDINKLYSQDEAKSETSFIVDDCLNGSVISSELKESTQEKIKEKILSRKQSDHVRGLSWTGDSEMDRIGISYSPIFAVHHKSRVGNVSVYLDGLNQRNLFFDANYPRVAGATRSLVLNYAIFSFGGFFTYLILSGMIDYTDKNSSQHLFILSLFAAAIVFSFAFLVHAKKSLAHKSEMLEKVDLLDFSHLT